MVHKEVEAKYHELDREFPSLQKTYFRLISVIDETMGHQTSTVMLIDGDGFRNPSSQA